MDYSWVHPSVDELVRVGCRGVLCYISPNPQGQFNTPPRDYLTECVRRGVSVSPIFEQGGEQPNEGYDRGRVDGERAVGWMERVGVPDGVRLFVNMADTPGPSPLDAIRDYATGFAETFPARWQLGSYGNFGAIRAAKIGSARFGKLWAVETWYPNVHGTVEDHWQFWQGQPDVALVQMANIGPPIAGTDVNWLIPGQVLDGWGTNAPTVHGFRYPLDGPMRVNSPWGMRNGSMHWGIDLWARNGDPAYAVAPGTCFSAHFESGAGNHIAFTFDHPPTPAAPKFGYMHMQDFAVKPGDHVHAGQLIGHTDNTGASQGPHLHFWIGENANVGAVDPTPFLEAGPVVPINWHDVAAMIRALEGGNAMALIPNYLGNEISLLVNDDGNLVHNARTAAGQHVVVNEVLARHCDRAVQPAARVDGVNLIITCASVKGHERRIVWRGDKGGWVTDPNGVEWKIGADA